MRQQSARSVGTAIGRGRSARPQIHMVAGRPRSMLVALLVRSCASAIAVPPTARITVDAAAYGRAKRRAVSESWSHKLEVEDFLTRADFLARARVANEPPARPPPMVLDVRAPCEYEKGHIPGALSFPLFDDAERAEVGALPDPNPNPNRSPNPSAL